ncbi:MAG: transcriptional regulator [Rhodothalassiaceae bacterium]|nr:MAG: transcriptional regulator [Rhodothalassiaceae bacterium]
MSGRAGEARRLAKEIDAFVGRRIRERRLAAGITQQELAAALGLSYQQVQKYENGSNRISAGRLYVLARLLGADVTDFFPRDPFGRLGEADIDPILSFSEDAIAAAKDLMAVDSPRVRQALRALLRALRHEAEQGED